MSSIQANNNFANLKGEELARFVEVWAQEVSRVVNGKLDFQTNFNCKFVSITFSSANTDTSINHGLGRVPAGYIVTSLTAALVPYDGTVPSTDSTLTLRASATGTAGLLIY